MDSSIATHQDPGEYVTRLKSYQKIANRNRWIPEEGLILKSKEEIQQYFGEWKAKSRSTQLNKLQKLKERADKLDSWSQRR